MSQKYPLVVSHVKQLVAKISQVAHGYTHGVQV